MSWFAFWVGFAAGGVFLLALLAVLGAPCMDSDGQDNGG